jgi:RNA polymerase sigma-70 factor (sigma-E family)
VAQDGRAAGAGRARAARRTSGDAAEFERFVTRHAADVSRLAFMLTGDSHEADDLAADVLLAAWRQWDDVKSADSPQAYVRRITSNMAASRIRRRTRWRALLPAFAIDAKAVDPGMDGAGVDVRRALAKLPPGRRSCVVLRLAFDLPEREVADILQISVGTVKSQTSKAVKSLRGLLAEDDERIGEGMRAFGGTDTTRRRARPSTRTEGGL